MRELEVIGVRVEQPTNQPLVLLREMDAGASGRRRYLPIWIGAVEASAVAFAQQGEPSERPPTHELMRSIVEALGDELDEVRIVDVSDGVFFASLVFASGTEVDARPSDSIALALRAGARIVCAEDVLDAAGLEGNGLDQGETPDEDAEVAKFREFLDHVDPEDFG